jgi:FAD-dependent monooxygenase
VYRVLGADGNKHRIQIDEILVDSEWTPNFSIADQYHTDNLRVFLAGDAGEITKSPYFIQNHKEQD